ncbi:F-box/LRR-repeat protein 15 [Diprion similis]|uniref:F-box/LRR-repeat protein 15 n=1 Tax=Diprion similis TaxID=362088 RepID=UPI001EF8569B|nr:F-box/LRR-repeat protein 15 [Diprion similis]XP_046752469.1 F-box/LRR-repeat protein 15 [Diprion similis]
MIHLVDLPWVDVVYAHIFSHLNLQDLFSLRCVSKELCLLVDKYFVPWQSLDLSDYTCIGSTAFGVLVRSCNNLKYVNLKNNNWLDSIQLMLLLHKHCNLTALDLSGCNNVCLHRSSIDISKCQNLTSIKLQNCTWVTERFLLNLAQCTKLQEVILADCYQVSDQAVISFCQNSGR